METNYHIPVLRDACIEALNIKPNGVYVDVTFGGGGHSRQILELLGKGGKLYGFDQDTDACANVPQGDERFKLIISNFRHLKRQLRLEGVRQVDGILADLGVSSHQFDEAERGFSFRFDADLDMRMSQQSELDAQDVLNTYNVERLQEMFSEYGEVRNARTLAMKIAEQRQVKPFKTIADLLAVCEPIVMGGKKNRYLAQVFQALRMEVNDEMGALQEMLIQAGEVLAPEGRLVVLSYHSLEDRQVKYFMRNGNFEGERSTDLYGRSSQPLKPLWGKPVEPDEAEIALNPRARSAKLRVGVKM